MWLGARGGQENGVGTQQRGPENKQTQQEESTQPLSCRILLHAHAYKGKSELPPGPTEMREAGSAEPSMPIDRLAFPLSSSPKQRVHALKSRLAAASPPLPGRAGAPWDGPPRVNGL